VALGVAAVVAPGAVALLDVAVALPGVVAGALPDAAVEVQLGGVLAAQPDVVAAPEALGAAASLKASDAVAASGALDAVVAA
jgi:hypothetical protein